MQLMKERAKENDGKNGVDLETKIKVGERNIDQDSRLLGGISFRI